MDRTTSFSMISSLSILPCCPVSEDTNVFNLIFLPESRKRVNHLTCSPSEIGFPPVLSVTSFHLMGKPGYKTERLWQDFDFSQNAMVGLFFATTLSKKRLAFMGRLSRRALQCTCLRRLLSSLESLRRRSCRTMP